MKLNFDESFYKDLNLTDSLKKFSKFKSNRDIFATHNKILKIYDSIYKSKIFISTIINKQPAIINISNENNYIVVYKIHIPELDKNLKNLKNKIDELNKREQYSFLLFEYMLYPLEKLFNIFNK